MVDRLTQERIARNDATFRNANEQIVAVAEEQAVDDEMVPVICECADRACTDLVLLTTAEYAEIRSNPRWFMNVPGHERAALGTVVVVYDRDDYIIVEKIGHAGEVAEELAESSVDTE